MTTDASQLPATCIGALTAELRRRGYRVIAPVARDGALVLDEVRSGAELPWGLGVETGPGHYRLVERGDRMLFASAAGPMPWKRFLRPPREKILDVERTPVGDGGGSDIGGEGGRGVQGGSGGFVVSEPDAHEEPPLAFLGVRPCDLRALTVLDRVMLAAGSRSPYAVRRARAFIVAVECTSPAETCFCVSASMSQGTNCGPGATPAQTPGAPRYDLLLTEVDDRGGHRFLARSGSCRGAEVLARIPHTPADGETVMAARRAVADAAEAQSKSQAQSKSRAQAQLQSRRPELPIVDLRSLMAASVEAKHWNDIAQRCLACGNCTLVCPTCFCTTTEDTTDLTGEHAERWNSWASCFDLDFSYVHGGEVRGSVESRYRQWLTHKFGTWQDQFGSSGCVGCGRCVAWCPAGIDLTEELRSLQQEWVLEANSE